MKTSEAKVKDQVKRIFKSMREEGVRLYYHMPVQNGMGKPTLDFIGCIEGKFFAIETKAPGKHPTPRQIETIKEMKDAGAFVTVFDGTNEKIFRAWLESIPWKAQDE